MPAYYNELDPYAAQWLRNLIARNLIAPGDVDERSITNVRSDDLKGYTQCHFFAGIGGWSLAARLAGWGDDRELWTGSCPCQPFSVAGKQAGQADERHLWPTFAALISARRPAVVMGEQVAAAVGKDWLDGVHSDLEGIGYACGAAVVPACAVDAPHRRDRLWFVADTAHQCIDRSGDTGQAGGHEFADGCGRTVAHANSERGIAGQQASEAARYRHPAVAAGGDVGNPNYQGWDQLRDRSVGQGTGGKVQARPSAAGTGRRSHWADSEIQRGRRINPSIRLLAHGVPARVGKLRAYGNAIVPQVAAEIIAAYMESARP